MSDLTTLEQLGILAGVLTGAGGLALGVLNTIQQHRDSRPRLRVRFGIWTMIDRTHGPGGPVEEDVGLVEIANIGRVPATPSLLGIERKGRTSDILVVSPQALDGGPFPREIAPGHTCNVRFLVGSIRELARQHTFRRAYVKSAIGDVFFGTRREMREFQKRLLFTTEQKRSAARR